MTLADKLATVALIWGVSAYFGSCAYGMLTLRHVRHQQAAEVIWRLSLIPIVTAAIYALARLSWVLVK